MVRCRLKPVSYTHLVEYIRKEIDELHKNRVKLVVMGDYHKLPRTAVMEVPVSYTHLGQNV